MITFGRYSKCCTCNTGLACGLSSARLVTHCTGRRLVRESCIGCSKLCYGEGDAGVECLPVWRAGRWDGSVCLPQRAVWGVFARGQRRGQQPTGNAIAGRRCSHHRRFL